MSGTNVSNTNDNVPGVGDEAPDFSLVGTTGTTTRLSDLRDKQRALLVFYPEDMTSTCSLQLAAIRHSIQEFTELETVPFGVNEGDATSHQCFIDELSLPFDLLIDEGLRVSEAYGTLKPNQRRISRTVVIVSKNGTIMYRQPGNPPPSELLEAIRADAGASAQAVA